MATSLAFVPSVNPSRSHSGYATKRVLDQDLLDISDPALTTETGCPSGRARAGRPWRQTRRGALAGRRTQPSLGTTQAPSWSVTAPPGRVLGLDPAGKWMPGSLKPLDDANLTESASSGHRSVTFIGLQLDVRLVQRQEDVDQIFPYPGSAIWRLRWNPGRGAAGDVQLQYGHCGWQTARCVGGGKREKEQQQARLFEPSHSGSSTYPSVLPWHRKRHKADPNLAHGSGTGKADGWGVPPALSSHVRPLRG